MLNKIVNYIMKDLIESIDRLEKKFDVMTNNHLKHIQEDIQELKELIKNNE